MGAPVIRFVHVGHRRGQAALGHHGVRLAQQGLTNNGNARALRQRFDRGSKSRSACADDHYVVFVGFVFCGHSSRMSLIRPEDTRRM